MIDVVCELEGGWNPERAFLEFPTGEQTQRRDASPEYQERAPWRARLTRTRAIALEGVEGLPEEGPA